jgi:Big-like domain-containing protein
MTARRSTSHVRIVTCLLLLSVSASGCGFIFSHGPPEGHARLDDFSCTESNAGPITDIIWLGLFGLTLATGDLGDYDPARVVVASSALTAVSGSAAVVGFNKSKRCRAAKRQLAERQVQARVPRGVVVSPRVDTLAVGERVQFTATAHTSSGLHISTAVFTWSSSNDAIASVTDAGLVEGHAIGSVVITARTDRVIGTAHLIVVREE